MYKHVNSDLSVRMQLRKQLSERETEKIKQPQARIKFTIPWWHVRRSKQIVSFIIDVNFDFNVAKILISLILQVSWSKRSSRGLKI